MTHIFLGICISGGSVFDLVSRRIPNIWLAIWILAGICWTPKGPMEFLLSMAVLIMVFSPVFLFRMIGAGDVKLMAVICGYLGLSDGFWLITCSFFIGAAFSLLQMLRKGIFFDRIFYFIAYFRRFIQTRELTAYYKADRDGYEAVIHFGLCLWLGFLAYLLFH